MVDTIEKALSPVSLITFVLGFGILYPLGESRYRLSIFYLLIVWSVYACAFCYAMTLFVIKSVFNSLLAFFVVIVNLFVAIISIIIIFCKHKKYRQFIRKLGHVDDTLEKLGISKEYHRMQHFMKQILITWILVTFLSWIFDTVLCATLYNDIKATLIPSILFYSIYANTITDITFLLLLRHVSTRLDKINDYIEQLSEIESYGLRYKWKRSLIVRSPSVRGDDRKRVLWIVIHLHSELCRTACNINDFFGMQMTLQMISYFIILIAMFYFQLHTMLYSTKQIYGINTVIKIAISNNVWFMVFLSKFISLNYICECVSTKAQKTKGPIHKLTNLNCFAEERNDICQFVLQISLRPLKFSGLGLFYFGYGFIRKFFMWMVTAIIFMTQMDFTPLWSGITSKDNVTYDM